MKKKRTTLNWFEYYFGHCWMTGWQNIRGSFRIWSDLMWGNYKDYALMWYDDPYEECYSWFWTCLGDDDTLPKEFLEHLQQMVEDIDAGKVKTYPMEDVMKHLEWADEVLDGVDLNEELPDEKCPYCGENEKPCSHNDNVARAYACGACNNKYKENTEK